MTPYYERDGITIYNADCLEVMPQLEPGFDAVIADPPYGQTACEWDNSIPLEPMWENYKRLVKARGAVVLFGDEPFTSFLIISNLEWFKYRWVWEKSIAANFMNAKLRPLQKHEDIIVFSSGMTANNNINNMTYHPQGIKRVNQQWKRPSKYPSEHRFVRPSHKLERVIEYSNYPNSILDFPHGNNDSKHPTQKPVALMAYLIRTYTNPGDLVLDNAMGSGTTLVAAQNEGRRAVGIELDEKYCQIAVERLRQPSFWSIPDEPKEVAVRQLPIGIE